MAVSQYERRRRKVPNIKRRSAPPKPTDAWDPSHQRGVLADEPDYIDEWDWADRHSVFETEQTFVDPDVRRALDAHDWHYYPKHGDQHEVNQAFRELTDHSREVKRTNRNRRGASNPAAKLTETQVIQLREQHAAGRSTRSLAAEVGVSHVTVSRAIRGVTWSHVEPKADP